MSAARPTQVDVVKDKRRFDANGNELNLYSIIVEKLTIAGWGPDEIVHCHAYSTLNAKLAYWLGIPIHLHRTKRIVDIGLSIGGQVLDDHGDQIVI